MDDLADSVLRPGYRPTVGLVLTGGGSRSAYQVGVLMALAEFLPRARNPFQIIVGTSAGAVAASVLAAEAHAWRRAVAGLERVWANFRSSQVFHVDTRHMLRAGIHWVLALISGGLVLSPPKSLLDNSPLRELLGVHVDCAGIRRSIARGHLRAFALCSTSYSSGRSVAFFDGIDSIGEWSRVQRIGQRTELTIDHLMASAAIPLLFPPIKIGDDYFGDGAMRQIHPLSPAIHLGADRLLVIGVRARRAAGVTVNRVHIPMPTPGEIFGYMLDTLFTDQIYGDLEQLERINELVEEEEKLLHRHEGEGLDDDEHARLEEIKIQLDKTWDYLRQRRSLREAGDDPDQASERDGGTVEDYGTVTPYDDTDADAPE